MDEPEPVGNSKGPNATMALAAAIGNCLCASLLFCLRRSRVNVLGIKAIVKGSWVRNKEGRWRIMEIEVEITPEVDEDHIKQMERCTDIFERFCVVSQSVREGIAIDVKVRR
jgi:organic hydroperoxide reductase OsmC/OhrA